MLKHLIDRLKQDKTHWDQLSYLFEERTHLFLNNRKQGLKWPICAVSMGSAMQPLLQLEGKIWWYGCLAIEND